MAKKKAVVGDILEAKTPASLAYLQYTHELSNMGSLVRVLPGLFVRRPTDFVGLARKKELYFTFYTLRHAVRDGDVEIVSRQPVPDWAKPYPRMRHSADSDRTGKTLLWRIVQADTPFTLEELSRAPSYRQLPPELEKLSIHELRSHPSLVYDLARQWTPERAEELRLRAVAEKNARKAQDPSLTSSQMLGDQHLRHYLYFPNKANAEIAGARLRERGFQVGVRKGADGLNWLALASSAASVDENDLERTRKELEGLAAELGGEYDGWEIEVDTAMKSKPVVN